MLHQDRKAELGVYNPHFVFRDQGVEPLHHLRDHRHLLRVLQLHSRRYDQEQKVDGSGRTLALLLLVCEVHRAAEGQRMGHAGGDPTESYLLDSQRHSNSFSPPSDQIGVQRLGDDERPKYARGSRAVHAAARLYGCHELGRCQSRTLPEKGLENR